MISELRLSRRGQVMMMIERGKIFMAEMITLGCLFERECFTLHKVLSTEVLMYAKKEGYLSQVPPIKVAPKKRTKISTKAATKTTTMTPRNEFT